MKKFLGFFLGTLGLWCMFSCVTKAESFSGDDDWHVTFTKDQEMVSNFTTDQFDDVLDNLQPGDSASFQVMLLNGYETGTDWYMTNEVLKSMEDESLTAKDGAYSYILTYTNPSGMVKTLYNSEEVGGENTSDELVGLHEATNALKDFFYLDTLRPGESGAVNLYVLLDGETQGNDYQDTLGRLQMNFAVELPAKDKSGTGGENIVYRYHDEHIVNTAADEVMFTSVGGVKTGDELELLPVFIAAIVLGVILLIISIVAMRLRTKMRSNEK